MSKQKKMTDLSLKVNRRVAGKIVFLLCLLVFAGTLLAQPMPGEKVQMADGLRSSGKIYVVVAVLLTILAGLFLYIISIDRKIRKMEKEEQV